MATAHYSNWSDIGYLDMAKLYLYGTTAPSENYDERLRPESEAGAAISVSMGNYMLGGPGRYATPDRAEIVQAFFDENNALADGPYTLTQLL